MRPLWVAVGLLGTFGWCATVRPTHGAPSHRPVETAFAAIFGRPTLMPSDEIGVEGASGIAYHGESDHLFVVGDRGDVVELGREGRPLRRAILEGDLEDVVVHQSTGKLLIVSERKARLILFDPASLSEVRRWRLDRSGLIGSDEDRRNWGFEGLAFRRDNRQPGGGVLYLAHQQSPATIVGIAFDPAAPPTIELGADVVLSRWAFARRVSLRALTYVSSLDRYLAIDGRRRQLLVLDSEGEIVAEFALPGVQPEGLCLDAQGTLWLADDREGVLRLPGALAALKARLGGPR